MGNTASADLANALRKVRSIVRPYIEHGWYGTSVEASSGNGFHIRVFVDEEILPNLRKEIPPEISGIMIAVIKGQPAALEHAVSNSGSHVVFEP